MVPFLTYTGEVLSGPPPTGREVSLVATRKLTGTGGIRRRTALSVICLGQMQQVHTLVKNIAQIGDILQLGLGNLSGVPGVSELVDNRLTKFVPHIRVTGQVEESRAEQAGGGITASQQDVEHFVSERLGVVGLLSQRITEDVPVLFLFRVPLGLEGKVHIVINHLVDLLVRVLEILRVDEPVEVLSPGPRGEVVLGLVECLGESLRVTDGGFRQQAIRAGCHAADGLSEQEVGCRVKGQEEEEALHVENGAVLGNKVDQMADVIIKQLQIRDLEISVVIRMKCLAVE